MAGRILPIALATVSGIAIGMATFGEELKAQRMKRLTEEYNRYTARIFYIIRLSLTLGCRDVAAAAAANSENPAAIAPAATATPPPALTQPPPVEHEIKPASTSWSDALGFWAWKKRPQQDAVPAALAAPAVAQEAPVKSTTAEQIKKP